MAIEERSSAKGAAMGTGTTSDQNVPSARNTLRETLVELQKTTWPTRAEANRLTMVVIGVIIALGIYMGLLDALFSAIDRMFNLT
jgi:preprotein translocase subunit SecE